MRGFAFDLINGKVFAVVPEVVLKAGGRRVRLEVKSSILLAALLVYPVPGIVGGEAVLESEIDWPWSCRPREIDRIPPTINLRSTFGVNDKLNLSKHESITAEMVSRAHGEIPFLLAEAILPTCNPRGNCAIAQLSNLVRGKTCLTQAAR